MDVAERYWILDSQLFQEGFRFFCNKFCLFASIYEENTFYYTKLPQLLMNYTIVPPLLSFILMINQVYFKYQNLLVIS